MSIPNASSSSALVSFAQAVDYTRMEGFKRFKASYNIKNARVARNNPCGAYLTAKHVFQAAKGPGCSQRTFNGLSLDDFISSGSVTPRRRLKRCTQKWDRRNNQGPVSVTIDTCRQLIRIVGTGLYHSMVDVQLMVG